MPGLAVLEMTIDLASNAGDPRQLFIGLNAPINPNYWRPSGAVTHRHQRVVHRLLLRMSPEPPPLPSAGSGLRIPNFSAVPPFDLAPFAASAPHLTATPNASVIPNSEFRIPNSIGGLS